MCRIEAHVVVVCMKKTRIKNEDLLYVVSHEIHVFIKRSIVKFFADAGLMAKREEIPF